MTKTEQILGAVVATLTAAGLKARTDTAATFSFEDMPAIVVDCGNESPQPVVGQGFVYWDLEVSLFIVAMGEAPKLAPESTRLAAHSALYADRTLGGLAIDVMAGPVSRRIDEENPAAGITEAVYQIKFRQQESIV